MTRNKITPSKPVNLRMKAPRKDLMNLCSILRDLNPLIGVEEPPKDLVKISLKKKLSKRLLKELEKLRSTTDLVIPKPTFLEFVKETTKNLFPGENYRMSSDAVGALHVACEEFFTKLS